VSFFEDFVAREVAPMVAAARALTQAERDELEGRLARVTREYRALVERAKDECCPYSAINNGHWDAAERQLRAAADLCHQAKRLTAQVEELERSLGRARLGRFH
jgi:hypothetical protein